MKKSISLLIWIFFHITAYSQVYYVNITGPTSVPVGQSTYYSAIWTDSDGYEVVPYYGTFTWTSSSATISGQSESSCMITWNSSGNRSVIYEYETWDNYYSDMIYVTVTTASVPPPQGLNATSIAANSFTANWSPVQNATGYRLDVSTSSSFSSFLSGYNDVPVSTTSKVVQVLSPGTTYYYRVRAMRSISVSGNSSTASALTLPAAPVANSGSSVGVNSFTANWASVPSATSYRLDVSRFSSFAIIDGGYGDISVTGTSKVVTGLNPATNYYYRVRAVNASGASANSNIVNVLTLPPAPYTAAPTNITANSFTANWGQSITATSYGLDVSTNSSFSSFVSGYNNLSVSTLSQSVTGLTPATTYYYRVRGVNSSGASVNSGTANVLTLTSPPVASPATNVTANSFTANWNNVTGASSYKLDVSTSSSFSNFAAGYNNLSVSGIFQNVTGLASGTTYYYRVRALNASGASLNSNTVSKLLLPAPPVANAASSVTTNTFVASWSSVPSATGYRLDVSLNSSFSGFVSGYNDLIVSTTSQSVINLSPGVTYYYRVRTVNATGASSNSGTISTITKTIAPVAMAASNISTNSFTANWGAVTGASSYKLDVSINGFSTYIPGYYNLTVSGTSQNVTALVPGTTYSYRVRAVNASGTSVNSGVQSAILYPSAPTAAAATNVSANSFTANWSASNGATGYRLDVSTNAGFTTFVAGYNNLLVTGVLSKTVTGLSPNLTYYYRVRAENATGISTNSGTITRKTLTINPTATVATNVTATSFIAHWNSVTGAIAYRLYVSTSSSFSSYVPGYDNLYVSGTTQTVTGLNPGTTYYYRVRANNGSLSNYSNTITVGSAADQNYVKTINANDKDLTTLTQMESATKNQAITQYTFFDGLGRPLQTVTKEASPNGNDVVQPVVHDAFGREAMKYLPFVANESSGWFKGDVINPATRQYQNAAAGFYTSGTGGIAIDTPYAKTVFEPSTLNRISKQGGHGDAWQPDASPYLTAADHSIKFSYETNDATEVLKWSYLVPSSSYPFGRINAATSGVPNKYAANKLFKNSTKDENQNEVITFTDDFGRVILKRVQAPGSTWADTYYIYDDFGDLITVIPPEAVKRITLTPSVYHTASEANRQAFLNLWAFRYRYDKRRRIIMKKIPGAEPVYQVYDDRDRLVMTQDGNQRNVTPTKEWTFTKYDFLNRPILTGRYLSNSDQAAMQTAVDSYYSVMGAGEAWFETYTGSTAIVLGYSNSSFPNVSAVSDYYTATYYDIYDSYIAPAGYTYLNESLPGQEAAAFPSVNGLASVTLVKNLSSGTFLRSVNYYDKKYRVIQTISDHHQGTQRTSNVYDFPGRLMISKRTYVVNSVTRTIKETYAYDHAGRLLNVKHSTDGAADVMIVKNEYNELGQLIDKKLHSTDGGTTFKQSVDHRYNIRGWLTKINEADVSGVVAGDPGYDYFGMELAYNDEISGLATTEMFNGNISAIRWSKGNGGSVGRQAYSFEYDPMNRLTEASHFDHIVTWQSLGRTFQEKINEYDLNGNIVKLSRRGFDGMLTDSLLYAYTGNKLNYIHDYGNQGEGFVNANTGTDDYDYDWNGNLDKDKNKGLSTKGNVKYNYLNLPSEITKGTEKIKYIYDASGRKLAQEVYSDSGGTLVKHTDYIGELVYEGGNLQFIQHPDGRVLPDGANWEYQYHLKDHLGNVRVTFTTKPQVPESHTANLENGNPGSGEGVFGNYFCTPFDLVDHTDAGAVYNRVQWLKDEARIGLTKSIAVMPGDRVSVSAFAKYMNLGATGNPNVFATTLTAAFGVTAGSTGDQLNLYNSLNDYGLGVAGGDHPGDDDSAPKCFVTILLFDRDFNLLDAGWDQVTTDMEQVSASLKEPFDDPLSKEVTVQEAGYAYIFLSNEHPTGVDVYFDDVTVSHTPSPIVSSSDYYPFGFSFNAGQKEGSLEQQNLFNGMELQDELNVGWYDYLARQYDPATGRFLSVDPAAELMRRHGVYNYGFDNPVLFTDPDGMFPEDSNDCGGDPDCEGKKDKKFETWLEQMREEGKVENVYQASGGGEGEEDGASAQQGGPGDPLDVRGIPAREPYGAIEYFFFGGLEDNGVWYNRDGTPRMKGVVSGTPPSWIVGPAGGLRTAGKGLQLLIQQNGIWRHAINGRVASQETLKRLGLARPTLSTTTKVSAAEKSFEETVTGMQNASEPLSKWEVFKRSVATIMGNLPF